MVLTDDNLSTTQNSDICEIDGDIADDVQNATVSGAPAKRKTTKRKNQSPLESEETILLKKALTALDSSEKNDEWDVFGQFVAHDLRQISNLIFRNAAKREIMKILLHYDSLTAPLILVEENVPICSESKETYNKTM